MGGGGGISLGSFLMVLMTNKDHNKWVYIWGLPIDGSLHIRTITKMFIHLGAGILN